MDGTEDSMGVLGMSQGVLWLKKGGCPWDVPRNPMGWTGLSRWKIVCESLGHPKGSYGTEGMDGTESLEDSMGVLGMSQGVLWD